MRPTFDRLFMDFAISLAKRSTCSRRQVGAVIVSADYRRILALGYNGSPSGFNNACESNEPGKCGHIHAEMNCVVSCVEPRVTEKYMYLTLSPCEICSKLIIQLGGITKVFYNEEYRDIKGLDLLKLANIQVIKL